MLPCYAQNWMDQRPQQPAVLQWKISPVSTCDAALHLHDFSTLHFRINDAALAGLEASSSAVHNRQGLKAVLLMSICCHADSIST